MKVIKVGSRVEPLNSNREGIGQVWMVSSIFFVLNSDNELNLDGWLTLTKDGTTRQALMSEVRDVTEPVLGWEKWRSIMDRIIHHPKYNYRFHGTQELNSLLRQSRFVQNQLAFYNARIWTR